VSVLLVSLPGFLVLSEDFSGNPVAAMLLGSLVDVGLEVLDNRGMFFINCENGLDSLDMSER